MVLFTLIIFMMSHAIEGTLHYDDCLKRGFEPEACHQSKNMHDLGKKLCDIQGKSFDNKVCK